MDTKTDKIALIKKWIAEKAVIPEGDMAWMIEEVEKADKAVLEAQKKETEMVGKLTELSRALVTAKHVLTLWLAVRGSNTEEFFQATQGLSDQTTKVLNA